MLLSNRGNNQCTATTMWLSDTMATTTTTRLMILPVVWFLFSHVNPTQLVTNPIIGHARKLQKAQQISSLELRSATNETELLERQRRLTTGAQPQLTLLQPTGLSSHFNVQKTTGPSIQYWMRTIRWRSRCYGREWFYLIQLLSVMTFAQSTLRWPKKFVTISR